MPNSAYRAVIDVSWYVPIPRQVCRVRLDRSQPGAAQLSREELALSVPRLGPARRSSRLQPTHIEYRDPILHIIESLESYRVEMCSWSANWSSATPEMWVTRHAGLRANAADAEMYSAPISISESGGPPAQ